MKAKLAAWIVIQRAKERDALNVVPMEVRNEDVSRKRALGELAFQLVAQDAKAGAAVENVDVVAKTHFNAGSIASIAQVLGLWSGRRAAHTPKLQSHSLEYWRK